MSDETKKNESVVEESDAQSELSDEQLEDAAGGWFRTFSTTKSQSDLADKDEKTKDAITRNIKG